MCGFISGLLQCHLPAIMWWMSYCSGHSSCVNPCDLITNLWSCCCIIPVSQNRNWSTQKCSNFLTTDSGRSRAQIPTQLAPESDFVYAPMLRILLPVSGGCRPQSLWVATAMDFGLQVKNPEFEAPSFFHILHHSALISSQSILAVEQPEGPHSRQSTPRYLSCLLLLAHLSPVFSCCLLPS